MFKVQRDTGNVNSKILKTKNGTWISSSKPAVWDNKESGFIKEQETKGLFCILGLKTPFNKIPLSGDIFFSINRMR